MEPQTSKTDSPIRGSRLEYARFKMTMVARHHRLQQAFFVVILGAAFLLAVRGSRSPVLNSIRRGERIPILVFGIDAADKSQHTDTLLVSLFDPHVYSLSLLSIPRDTLINLPGYLFHRVNEIYGYHMRKKKNWEQAAVEVKGGVEHLLSTDQKPVSIPYYIQIDYAGFQKMVDIVGGVWVDVDQPMNYDDNAGNLHIHFEPGRHLVKGQEALRYVRFRGQTGDRGRILRQQEFLRNMAKRFANPMVIIKFPIMVSAVLSSVKTNMSFWDLMFLINEARRLRAPDVGFYKLPGRPWRQYWKVQSDATEDMVSQVFFGQKSTRAYMEAVTPLEDEITVNVWNASGKKGVAYDITRFLRVNKFDVVDWGTYTMEQKPTRVYDRRGNLPKAKKVAAVLGVENCQSEPNPNALADVDVVIGQDYQLPMK